MSSPGNNQNRLRDEPNPAESPSDKAIHSNPPPYSSTSPAQHEPPQQDNHLLQENLQLRALLQRLLDQSHSSSSTSSSNSHSAQLFRLDPASLQQFSSSNSDFDQLLQQYNVLGRTDSDSTSSTSNQPDFAVAHVDYDALGAISQSLNTQLNQQQQAPTTSSPQQAFSSANPNIQRTAQITGPNDQRTTLEVPSVPTRQQNHITELPSITSVQRDFYSQNTSLTIVTQRSSAESSQYQENFENTQLQAPSLSTSTSSANPEIWQEALVLDIPQSEFWVVVPHIMDAETRVSMNLEAHMEDSTSYHPTAAELEQVEQELLKSRLNEQFGTIVDDGFGDDGYVMIDIHQVQENIVQSISGILRNMTSTIGAMTDPELVEALQAALHLQEAQLVQPTTSTTHPPQQTTSTTSISMNGNTYQNTRVTAGSQSATPISSPPSRLAAQNATSPQSTTSTTNTTQQRGGKEPPISQQTFLQTAQFISDSVQKGTVDPHKAMQQIGKHVLPTKVTSTYSWAYWLYSWGSWAYSTWSYGAFAYNIYRNPYVSRTILTWVYRGITYALVFLL